MKSRHRILLSASLLGGLVTTTSLASAQKLLHTHIGTTNQERLSSELRAAGDIDGDLLGDYILGVPSADTNGQNSGEVRVYSGADGSLIRSHQGPVAGDQYGQTAAGVGDVNGDGRSDVLIGTHTVSPGGIVILFSGLDGSVLHTNSALSNGDSFGYDVTGVGDVNLDLVPDYAVGASNDNTGPNGSSGAVHVYSGASGALLFSRSGNGHVDGFGRRIRGAGDVNGDGRGDILVGAPWDDDGGSLSGVAHMISGLDGSTIWSVPGEASGDYFGHSLDAAGADMNNDGVPDVVVGTESDSYVHILSGADGSLIRRHDQVSTGGSVAFGRGLCALNDVNGDGFGDYVVGDSAAFLLGQARLYSGATGDELFVVTWQDQNDGFGRYIGNLGDLTGDGRHEFGIGATGFDFGGNGNTGRVGVYSPQPPIGSRYCTPGVIGASGRPATLQVFGSTQLSENCLSLTANALPIGAFAYFIGGTGQASINPGGSIGFVCVGGANVARFNSLEADHPRSERFH